MRSPCASYGLYGLTQRRRFIWHNGESDECFRLHSDLESSFVVVQYVITMMIISAKGGAPQTLLITGCAIAQCAGKQHACSSFRVIFAVHCPTEVCL